MKQTDNIIDYENGATGITRYPAKQYHIAPDHPAYFLLHIEKEPVNPDNPFGFQTTPLAEESIIPSDQAMGLDIDEEVMEANLGWSFGDGEGEI